MRSCDSLLELSYEKKSIHGLIIKLSTKIKRTPSVIYSLGNNEPFEEWVKYTQAVESARMRQGHQSFVEFSDYITEG